MAKFYQEKYFITSDKAKIFYIDEGNRDSATTLFLHDFTRRGISFNKLAIELVNTNRIIFFDYRGHGKTKSEGSYNLNTLSRDLKELISHLNIKNVNIVAYGLGAFVLFEYIRHYGTSNLSKANIIDFSPKLLNNDDWNFGLYQGNYTDANFQTDIQLINSKPSKFLSYYYSQAMPQHTEDESRNYPPTTIYNFLGWFLLNKKSLVYWNEIILSDYRLDLSKINIPTNIIYAKPGSLFNENTAIYINSQIPNSKVYPILNSSHNNILLKTSQLIEIISGS